MTINTTIGRLRLLSKGPERSVFIDERLTWWVFTKEQLTKILIP